MKIADTVALVTGSASGVGLATVRELHAQGARVSILDLPSSQGKTTAEDLGQRAAFAPGDVTPPASATAALVRHIVENPMLNGETIRLDGAIRTSPR